MVPTLHGLRVSADAGLRVCVLYHMLLLYTQHQRGVRILVRFGTPLNFPELIRELADEGTRLLDVTGRYFASNTVRLRRDS